MKNGHDIETFLKNVRDAHLEYIDFRFTDLLGKFRHITYRADQVSADILKSGIGFDGSSIPGWKEIQESDMLLKPDVSTAFVDPFIDSCITVLCDVFDLQTQQKYARDPRFIAKKAEEYLKDTGIAEVAYIGPEVEFFVFDSIRFKNSPTHSFFELDSQDFFCNSSKMIENGNLGHRADHKDGYFAVLPTDFLYEIRADICAILPSVGIVPVLHHREVAAAQCEIGFQYSTLFSSADNVQKFKYIAQNVAKKAGKSITFMPKPICGDSGSGMHTHQSLWKEGRALFYEKGSYADLSEQCLYYIGGIMKHAKAINAFANPCTNSYKRLVPGFEAPVKLAYSAYNRSASIRIPYADSAKAKRIEIRFPDPSANPYLAFAAMLLAGIDGIINKIEPGAATDVNLYELPQDQYDKIPNISASLEESLQALDQDREFLKKNNVFTDEVIDSYIGLKNKEVALLKSTPAPIEFQLYYSV